MEGKNHQELQGLEGSSKTDQRAGKGSTGLLYGFDWQEGAALLS